MDEKEKEVSEESIIHLSVTEKLRQGLIDSDKMKIMDGEIPENEEENAKIWGATVLQVGNGGFRSRMREILASGVPNAMANIASIGEIQSSDGSAVDWDKIGILSAQIPEDPMLLAHRMMDLRSSLRATPMDFPEEFHVVLSEPAPREMLHHLELYKEFLKTCEKIMDGKFEGVITRIFETFPVLQRINKLYYDYETLKELSHGRKWDDDEAERKLQWLGDDHKRLEADNVRLQKLFNSIKDEESYYAYDPDYSINQLETISSDVCVRIPAGVLLGITNLKEYNDLFIAVKEYRENEGLASEATMHKLGMILDEAISSLEE